MLRPPRGRIQGEYHPREAISPKDTVFLSVGEDERFHCTTWRELARSQSNR